MNQRKSDFQDKESGETMTAVNRVMAAETSFGGDDPVLYWARRGIWPANWLAWPDPEANGCAYCLRLKLDAPLSVRLHVSGDRKYQLFCDGEMAGIGPELGDLNHYYFETYRLELDAGEHALVALVFDFKETAGLCEMGLRPGFLAAAEGIEPERMNTGFAPWEVLPIHAWSWIAFQSVNPNVDFRADAWFPGLENGCGEGWRPAVAAESAVDGAVRNEFAPERLLFPARLPARTYRKAGLLASIRVSALPNAPVCAADELSAEHGDWECALRGGASVRVAPHSFRRVIGTLSDYYCLYPRLTTRGGAGAKISLGWAEGLFVDPVWNYESPVKGHRDRIEGKYFVGAGYDIFRPAGTEMTFFTPWWRAGRYFELTVETGDEALEIGELALFETRYPFDSEIELATSDERLNRILPLCLRTVQMCMHDTFMDCPYYEQLMYIGDARLEALVVLAASHDTRMNEKMLRLFAASRRPDGFLYSRYPSRVCQVIPTFSPLWIAALHDHALFRGDARLLRELIGTAKQIADAFETRINSDGLLEFGQGWNFVDWTPDWCENNMFGVPPGGEYGVSGVVNWLYVYALVHLAELSEFLDEPLAAAHFRERARIRTERLVERFWTPERGLFADDLAKTRFSEHSQCLAILCGTLPEAIAAPVAENLFTAPDLARTSIYFTHYYFECCRVLRRMDAFFARMQLWFDCDGLGLATLLERPEPSRSDCHGWSGHLYFHVPATLAGIRPAEFGFRSVRIAPQPGALERLHAEMAHPSGRIVADYVREGERWRGTVTLPSGVGGEAVLPDGQVVLHSGLNRLEWQA